MYTAVAIASALVYAASLVIEARSGAGAGPNPPTNAALINTLRLGSLVTGTVGLCGALILTAAGV